MPETLFREIKITERFTAGGREFVGISQSFRSASGQRYDDESADAQASHLMSIPSCKTHLYRGLFGLPCLEAVRELIFAIVSWPVGLGLDQEQLKNLVFGPPDFDARLIPERGFCRRAVEAHQESQCASQAESFTGEHSTTL
jgi:hypothetical protein